MSPITLNTGVKIMVDLVVYGEVKSSIYDESCTVFSGYGIAHYIFEA